MQVEKGKIGLHFLSRLQKIKNIVIVVVVIQLFFIIYRN